jgi:hypothetical protein
MRTCAKPLYLLVGKIDIGSFHMWFPLDYMPAIDVYSV